MAMRMGKHCFCQKPLTHTIYEARLMAEVAREKKVATQMGNQGTADAAAAQGGGDGAGRGRGHGQGSPRLDQPADLAAGRRSGPSRRRCPTNLKWDLWLGPAPMRPYAQRAIIRSRGAAGGISAPAPWATWPATP